ncbi:flavin-dependent oxidoreductase [Bradyrhizobium sp. AUGA SZCCT0222]|uniref:flavin-dependent oxidoreductase n=1 Tax=Bradyrhizobium sp. AUGA SZCCT0222 TaxID=2807668 RepID=UPI001BA7AE79|nr:flavin-dependent oxidoreductase [Bradyrhizobium sp. AUGA SZCCT0222]MBR1271588.1 flavin-dependent oxidoreductase [Bradyrhizobium sp. AUGA SZCCT0222]
MKKMEIIVVGGGIGGLSLALSLHQAGINVRVYETVRDLSPLGVGINLQPAAVRELVDLGLGDALAETGNATQRLNLCNKFGQLIHSEPRGTAAGYRWPQYSIHRGRLQFLLLRAVRERIGQNFRSGLTFTTFEQIGRKVRGRFRDRESGTEVIDEADVLIGADGIHSAVRRQIHPTEAGPRFARQLMWRAAVEAEAFLDGRTMAIAGHFHQRIIAYPVARAASGKRLTNWLCQMTVPDEAPPREDWNKRVTRDKVLAAFGRWKFPWLDMPALIEQSPDIFEFPLVDRDPVSTWTCGRVTLLGDAAHPMQPIGSQAGSQAILDARLLTAALSAISNPVEALQHYDTTRRPVMNDITLRNRSFGPEAAMQLVEERAPNGFVRIEDVISRHELDSIANSFAVAAGLDVETVNNGLSFVHASREST